MEWSSRQYDLQQQDVRSRKEAEMVETSSNGFNATDEELTKQLLLDDKQRLTTPYPMEDPREINLTSSVITY